MKAPHEPFESLLDRARRQDLSSPERRRLEMVLRSNRDAELEWWLLSDFTYEQMEHGEDEDRTERAVERTLRVLGLAAQNDAEPELARTEPPAPASTEVRGHPATGTKTARALLAFKGQLGNRTSLLALLLSAGLGASGMAAATHLGSRATVEPSSSHDLRDLPARVDFHRTPRATLNAPSGRQVLVVSPGAPASSTSSITD